MQLRGRGHTNLARCVRSRVTVTGSPWSVVAAAPAITAMSMPAAYCRAGKPFATSM
jgi:hypothetical protein